MSRFTDAIDFVRHALKAKDVRNAIADSMEEVWNHVTSEKEAAALSASQALSYKNSAESSKNSAATSESNALSYKNAAESSKNSAATSAANSSKSEQNAANSAAAAANYAEKAASRAFNYVGFYASAEALRTAHDTSSNGYWAIVGTTDSIWIWDSDSNTWKDSHDMSRLSDYMAEASFNPNGHAPEQVAFASDIEKISGVAVGTIVPFAGNGDIPVGFLLCNGAKCDPEMYPDLFSVIGYTYGGETGYFRLPDLRDRFIEGAEAGGDVGGEASHSHEYGFRFGAYYGAVGLESSPSVGAINMQTGETAAHKSIGANSITVNGSATTTGSKKDMSTYETVGKTDVKSNLPPYITMRYIIKAFAGASEDSTDVAITQVANEVVRLSVAVQDIKSVLMPVGYIYQWCPLYAMSGGHVLYDELSGEPILLGGPDLSTPQKLADYLGFGTWQAVSEGRTLMGADATHEAGTTAEAGLPNIYGYFCNMASQSSTSAGEGGGAFYTRQSNENRGYATQQKDDGIDGMRFDASRWNPIYGNSETVQPPALFVHIYQRIA